MVSTRSSKSNVESKLVKAEGRTELRNPETSIKSAKRAGKSSKSRIAKSKSKPHDKLEVGSSAKLSPDQAQHVRTLLKLFLEKLKENTSTICPSQIARKMTELDSSEYPNWRELMDPVRDIVWECVEEGWVEVTQGGVVRSLDERDGIKGPIRVRRGKNFTAMEHEDGGLSRAG